MFDGKDPGDRAGFRDLISQGPHSRRSSGQEMSSSSAMYRDGAGGFCDPAKSARQHPWTISESMEACMDALKVLPKEA